jgi:DNA-binding transcriptional LysR family regulator
MDRLDALRVFVAVCDAKGFAPAARRLRLSPSVVTRLIQGLEERLGVRLLQRTTRSLHLTDAGHAYLERVRRILNEVEEADEVARGERVVPRGRLAVTAPVIFGRMHVAPLLRRYMGLYPEVTAELHLNDRNVHLVEEGIDVAVRIGALSDSSLVARRLGETRRVLVASPTYLRERGVPEHPHDLAQHDVVAFVPLNASREWTFAEEGGAGEVRIPITPRFSTNSGDVAIDFARAGFGLTRTLLYQVVSHLNTGELTIVLEQFELAASPIHAVYPTSRQLSAKVRALIDLITRTEDWRFAAGVPTEGAL